MVRSRGCAAAAKGTGPVDIPQRFAEVAGAGTGGGVPGAAVVGFCVGAAGAEGAGGIFPQLFAGVAGAGAKERIGVAAVVWLRVGAARTGDTGQRLPPPQPLAGLAGAVAVCGVTAAMVVTGRISAAGTGCAGSCGAGTVVIEPQGPAGAVSGGRVGVVVDPHPAAAVAGL